MRAMIVIFAFLAVPHAAFACNMAAGSECSRAYDQGYTFGVGGYPAGSDESLAFHNGDMDAEMDARLRSRDLPDGEQNH